MSTFSALAPIITNPLTNYGVVGCLMTWALISGVGLYRRTHKITKIFETAEQLIVDGGDRLEFAARNERVSIAIQAIPALRGRWREFADSLAPPSKPGRPIRSTTRPREWFDLSLLASRHVGVNMRYHAALPNLLVGAGLLFTFLGLAVALSLAGDIVDKNPTIRDAALKSLLETASFKFFTSLAGLALSIAYTIFQKSRLRRVESALENFLAAV